MPRIVDSEERRSDLGAAAARVIARSGIAGATMREVAAEAGWTTGALTHYFADKRELLQFTLDASLRRRRAERPSRDRLSPAEALRASLLSALPTDDDARLHWTVTIAFCAQATADEALAASQRDAYREFRNNVAELVRRAGRADADEAVIEAERLIALTDGIAIQALFDPASWPAERQITALDAGLSTSTSPSPV
jgi:AcrR family transcriptional regulator